ncbi:MAG: ribonuclease R [Alphaproteobacteria bacterium]|nr:ribonuclease R [Alphaproteobacteria bacterium]
MSFLIKETVFDFIKTSSKPVTKREVARAFGIKGGENRVALKQILKSLEKEGSIVKQPGGVYSAPDGLPSVAVVCVHEIDADGDVYALPLEWDEELHGLPPRIEIIPDKKNFRNIRENSRALCRLSRTDDKTYEARIIRLIDQGARYEGGNVLGILHMQKNGAVLQSTNKRAKHDFSVAIDDLNSAKDGDLVSAEILSSHGLSRKRVRITKVLGSKGDPKTISLIALHEAGLSDHFPQNVLDQTKDLKVPPLGKREDLRDIPLVTIDGADARDFDDAVFAEKLEDGSYHLIVAIADVAHYVHYGSALDKEALKRGNSTYFPDRVVPMLPEALSNDLCSLCPGEVRASLIVHLYIDKSGKLLRYKFARALIKSHARLTYEQVQTARDGNGDQTTAHLIDPVINPLYDVYKILEEARQKRGALDLDLPERQIIINEKGIMTGVKPRTRLDAHKLIEEFMILANVAAASALEEKIRTQKGNGDYPCVYRIHDKPSYDKLEGAREFIESFNLSMPKGQNIRPQNINALLHKAAKLPYSHLISQMILRCQSQAVYSVNNIGHFGLALERYAHFTSPIRRYADLLIHRALIGAYGLGNGAMGKEESVRIEEMAEHISGTERTSMEAERSAVDRFTASYLSSHIGAEFPGTINGVTHFGLFVTLDESGADGLIPMRNLGRDFFIHDETAHALVGRHSGNIYRLGAHMRVVIKEADGMTGSCIFDPAPGQNSADIPGMTKPKATNTSQRHRPDRAKTPHRDFQKDRSRSGNKPRGRKNR